MQLTIGDKIKVIAPEFDSKRFAKRKTLTGTVIYTNKYFFTMEAIKNNGQKYKESFLYSALKNGEIKVGL